ncbi:putative cysteine-rich receptor-like protein kinase 31 [Quercus suber]|uniref:Cysteine-rich receptor-like protein kinase 31 n=1 Tax=Quercus suber TaxID=58331 RepID=A0AAW0JHP5_QUESU
MDEQHRASKMGEEEDESGRRWSVSFGVTVRTMMADEDNRELRCVTVRTMRTRVSFESLQFDFAAIEGATDKFSDDNKLGEGGFEYTMFRQFSLKFDVYSFGVLILEILTGEKNSPFCQENSSEDLLSYAWEHWRDKTPLELLDPTLGDSYTKNEVIRSLHIGLHYLNGGQQAFKRAGENQSTTKSISYSANRKYQLLNYTLANGFYKTSVGQNPQDVALVLLFCRGDLTSAACKDCISTATKDIRNHCPFDKIILIWYDVCTLRYTNESDLNNLVPFENFNTTARMSSSQTGSTGKSNSSATIIAIAVPVSVAMVLFAIGVCFLRRTTGIEITAIESLQFDLVTTETATNKFSDDNKIGKGGFGKTWKQWKNGTPIELLDPTMRGSHSRNEVIRCIHIGLLCVQENPANRPTMATVGLRLDSYSVSLQLPQQPAFLLRNKANRNMPKKELQHDSFSSQSVPWSVDGEPITELYPR